MISFREKEGGVRKDGCRRYLNSIYYNMREGILVMYGIRFCVN